MGPILRPDWRLHGVSGGRGRPDDARVPARSDPAWAERAAAVRDPTAPAYVLPRALAAEVYQHARECYPEECCGLLLARPGAPAHRIVRCTNVQGTRAAAGGKAVRAARDVSASGPAAADSGELRRLAAADDASSPALSARHAFWMDERELLIALRTADARGEELCAVYHSHIDTEAYLSWIDADCAVGPSGTPHYPGAAQLVLSVREGTVRDAVAYVWDRASQRFVGRGLLLDE